MGLAMIKHKPWWLTLVTPASAWVTIHPNIYYPEGTVVTDWPDIIAHENVHLSQQEKMGRFLWLFRYFTNRSFRLDQECEAIVAELFNMPPHMDKDWRMKSYAELLSTRYYFWAAPSRNDALIAIRRKTLEVRGEL